MAEGKPKVAICMPSGSHWLGGTGFSLLCLGIFSAAQLEIDPMNMRGHDTAESRNQMTRAALERGNEWLLWIDSDQTFPPDGLIRLMKHDLDIVGADYRRRTPPFPKIGLAVNPADPLGPPLPQSVDGDEPKEGLVERAVLGCGFLLVRAAVFAVAPGPWWMRTWNEHAVREDNPYGMTTEDCLFCHAVRMRGYKVWEDRSLSAEIGHIGEFAVLWNKGLRQS